MKEIDFRPDWYCEIRKHKRDTFIRASLLGVLMVEFVLCFLAMSSRNAEAQQQLSEVRNALENQMAVYENFGELVVDLSELQFKQAILSDVAGGAPVHAMLAELSGLMPDSLGINTVSYTQHRLIGRHSKVQNAATTTSDSTEIEKPNRLEISGLAASDRDIGILMKRMADNELFANVALIYSQPMIAGKSPAREFELACTVAQFE